MSESRGGESRSYSSYIPCYSSYGESRSSGESRTSSPSYQSNYGESRESRGSSYTPQKSSKPTKRKSKDIGDIRSQVMQELYDELYGES